MERMKTMEKAKQNHLVKKAVKGDKKAFEELVKVKLEPIMFGALSIMGQHHDAEDATQEIIVKMYKNINQLKDPSAFTTWMHKIINTQCYNMLRERKKRKGERVGVDDYLLKIEDNDREFLPQSYVDDKESQKLVREIISNLPIQRRQIVTMYYYDDMSYKEIGEVLGISPGTVGSDLRRAKAQIKSDIEKANNAPINPAEVNKCAAVPVLSQILAEQAHETMTPAMIKNLMTFTQSKVTAGTATKGVGAFTAKKIVAAVLCTTILTTGTTCTINAVNNNTKIQPAQEEAKYTGHVIYKDGVCDCSHVNPREITLEDINDSYTNATWIITSDSTNQEYKGQGISIKEEVRNLYQAKQDGQYTVLFTLQYPEGDLMIDHKFEINTSGTNIESE